MSTDSMFKFKKVLALPQALDPNTVYFVSEAESSKVEIKVSTSDGSGVRDVATNPIIISPTVPSLTDTTEPFWWDSATGTLFIRYTDPNNNVNWVEAQGSIQVPQFGAAGGLNGTSDLMARYDHSHNGLTITSEW